MLKYLNIDADHIVAYAHADLWAQREIGLDRYDTMTEAIQRLTIEQDYLFIAINGDSVDFMPLLSTMRSITHLPILIVVKGLTTKVRVAALNNGADLCENWNPTPEENIDSVIAYVKSMERRSKRKRPSTKVYVQHELLIAPSQRYTFVGNKKIDLTRYEFDLLHLLMSNHGKMLTQEQIYKRVWKTGSDNSSRNSIWDTIKRIRAKLKIGPEYSAYIETIRDVGYRFPLGWE